MKLFLTDNNLGGSSIYYSAHGNLDTSGGGGVLPYKGLMGTCGQSGYVFRDFRLKQGIEFIDLSIFVLNRINVLNRVSKIGILS